jgi:hypothetical protein
VSCHQPSPQHHLHTMTTAHANNMKTSCRPCIADLHLSCTYPFFPNLNRRSAHDANLGHPAHTCGGCDGYPPAAVAQGVHHNSDSVGLANTSSACNAAAAALNYTQHHRVTPCEQAMQLCRHAHLQDREHSLGLLVSATFGVLSTVLQQTCHACTSRCLAMPLRVQLSQIPSALTAVYCRQVTHVRVFGAAHAACSPPASHTWCCRYKAYTDHQQQQQQCVAVHTAGAAYNKHCWAAARYKEPQQHQQQQCMRRLSYL